MNRRFEFEFMLPDDFTMESLLVDEVELYRMSSKGRCAPRLTVDFYGGGGAMTCGPIERRPEEGMLFGRRGSWVVGSYESLDCGLRLWARALVLDGGVTIDTPTRDDMEKLRRAVAGAVVVDAARDAGVVIELQRDSQREPWSFSPECGPPRPPVP